MLISQILVAHFLGNSFANVILQVGFGGPRAASAAGTALGERLLAKEHESRFPLRLVALVLFCFPSSNEESENI